MGGLAGLGRRLHGPILAAVNAQALDGVWQGLAMVGVVLTVALAAAPGLKVAVPAVSYVNLTEREGDAFVDAFGQQLSQSSGADVITRTQLTQLIGLERQRELLGCTEAANTCMAELSGALGAEAIVTGSLGRLGTVFTVTLKLSRGQGALVSSFTARARNEAELLEALQAGAGQFARALRGEAEPVASARFGPRFWIPASITLGLGLAGGISLGVNRAAVSALQSGTFAGAGEIAMTVERGEVSRGLAVGFLVAAAVSLGVTVVLALLPEPARAVVASVMEATP